MVVWNVFTQALAQYGIAGWWLGQPWLQEGLEYLEAGRIADVVILIGFAILTYVVLQDLPADAQVERDPLGPRARRHWR